MAQGASVQAKALQGRVAWVTGSSRGLGRAIAAHLASLGARVVVHGTTPTSTRAFDEADSLSAVAKAIADEHGVETLAVHGDLGDAETVDRVVAEIHAAFQQIDILVHAAGGDIGAAGTAGPKEFGRKAKSHPAQRPNSDQLTGLEGRHWHGWRRFGRPSRPASLTRTTRSSFRWRTSKQS